ncbi:PAS domain-containing protein [Roseomonas harenae]|uniref:PAS domain-containing protein n=1 Tax=Muricoccus harenae TaxID=2692566 RepID=UPI00133188E7
MSSSPGPGEQLTGCAERPVCNCEIQLKSIHPADHPIVHDAVRRVLERETNDYEAEFRAVCPDGTVRWLRSVGPVTADADGSAREIRGGLCQPRLTGPATRGDVGIGAFTTSKQSEPCKARSPRGRQP